MAGNKAIEKQKLLKIISNIPFKDEDKVKWQAQLEENVLTEEMLEEIHQGLKSLPSDAFASDWLRMKYNTDLARFIQQWRMSTASKNFKHGH